MSPRLVTKTPADGNPLDNTPNARKLLASMRYLGYDNEYAICDIVDNAIDAGAVQIRVFIERTAHDDFLIDVVDNGVGMSEAMLDQASRLGSNSPRDVRTDLGRFGMGLVTAALSLGRRLTVVTRQAKGQVLANITDIDTMEQQNRFVRDFFGPANEELTALFHTHFGAAESGTLVRISKCDGFKRRYVRAAEQSLSLHLGQTYRMFLRAGRSMSVNAMPVLVHDPLWLDGEPTAEIYMDERFEIGFTNADGLEVRDEVRARLVILPDLGSPKENKRRGYKVEKSGFYVLRNNREIAAAQTLHIDPLSRHPDFIRFRAELFIPGTLDDAFGIEFTKRDIKLPQSVRDQLQSALSPNIRSLRQRLQKKNTKAESDGVSHDSSEQFINANASLLIKPPTRATAELELAPNNTPLGAVKFRQRSFGAEGPIYAAEQQGKTIFVDWNIDHPFYAKVVLTLRDEKAKLNAIDALIFCMASAELKVFDEEHQEFIASWRTIVSSNLRYLLS